MVYQKQPKEHRDRPKPSQRENITKRKETGKKRKLRKKKKQVYEIRQDFAQASVGRLSSCKGLDRNHVPGFQFCKRPPVLLFRLFFILFHNNNDNTYSYVQRRYMFLLKMGRAAFEFSTRRNYKSLVSFFSLNGLLACYFGLPKTLTRCV